MARGAGVSSTPMRRQFLLIAPPVRPLLRYASSRTTSRESIPPRTIVVLVRDPYFTLSTRRLRATPGNTGRRRYARQTTSSATSAAQYVPSPFANRSLSEDALLGDRPVPRDRLLGQGSDVH